MKLLNSKTYFNLAKAFCAETLARTRYEFMEYGMRYNGYKTMAEIVDTIAYQEFNHARMFYTFLQKATDKPIDNIDISGGFPFHQKWDIEQNLQLAAEDEHVEAYDIYLPAAETAREEGFEDIANLFDLTAKVEMRHEAIFAELYRQMKAGTLYKRDSEVTWVCSACGHSATGKQAWDVCPLCGAKQGTIILNDISPAGKPIFQR